MSGPLLMEIVPLLEAPTRHLRGLTLLSSIKRTPTGSAAVVTSGMQALLDRAEHVEAYAVLGRVDHLLVGWAGLEAARPPWPDPDMFISVYVHPEFRRRGYGSSLVEAGLTFARDTRPDLSPCCIPFDEAGFQTFLKAGFQFNPEHKIQRYA